MIRKLLVLGAVVTVVVAFGASAASAHPLGNFTVNTAAALRIGTDGVIVDYAIDLAEIPTLQARERLDANGDGDFSLGEQTAYRDAECAKVANESLLRIDDRPVALVARGQTVAIVEGLAALPTTRITCVLRGDVDLSGEPFALTFESGYAAGRVGWHEVSAQGDRMTIAESSVPALSPSALLTNYPTTDVSSPPDVRRADVRVRAGGPALLVDESTPNTNTIKSSVPGVDRATRSFANLVGSRDLTLRLGVLSVAIAFVLGIFHAVAPGHGKTVMAAYLVGQRGTLKQALGVGASVTLTHTAGVLVLGLILSVSSVAAPENLYPWLGAFSGLLLASIGIGLLVRARRLRKRGIANVWHSHAPGAHGHVHPDWLAAAYQDDDETHREPAADRVLVASGAVAPRAISRHAGHDHGPDHHDHSHDHGPDHHDHGPDHHHHHHDEREAGATVDHHRPRQDDEQPMGWRWIVAMGFAGGMVPSPSALVVLLGAIALGRSWFGVALVSAYGIGMATTLVVAGLVLVRARARIEVLVQSERGQRFARVLSVLPIITAVIIVGGGLLIATRAIGSI